MARADLYWSSTGLKVGEKQELVIGSAAWFQYYRRNWRVMTAYARLLKTMEETKKSRNAFSQAAGSAASVPSSAFLSLVIEGSVGFFDGSRQSGLGGLRFAKALSANTLVYGQGLAGVSHSPDGTALSLQPGVGVQIGGVAPFVINLQLDLANDVYSWGHTTGLGFGGGILFYFK